jgi:hypothetical protein
LNYKAFSNTTPIGRLLAQSSPERHTGSWRHSFKQFHKLTILNLSPVVLMTFTQSYQIYKYCASLYTIHLHAHFQCRWAQENNTNASIFVRKLKNTVAPEVLQAFSRRKTLHSNHLATSQALTYHIHRSETKKLARLIIENSSISGLTSEFLFTEQSGRAGKP